MRACPTLVEEWQKQSLMPVCGRVPANYENRLPSLAKEGEGVVTLGVAYHHQPLLNKEGSHFQSRGRQRPPTWREI